MLAIAGGYVPTDVTWEEIATDLNELETLVQARESLDDALSRIADVARELTPHCDSASVFLADGRVPHDDLGVGRSIATDQFGVRIDELQIELDDGPCLQSMRTGHDVTIERIEHERRFTRFAPQAGAVGLRSAHSVALQIDEVTVGSLNLYSRDEPFGRQVQDVGRAMAGQAALAVAGALRLRDAVRLISDLRVAIASRDDIGKAKGILMERHGVSEDEAFARLVEWSQRSNVKLKDVATALSDGERETSPPQ